MRKPAKRYPVAEGEVILVYTEPDHFQRLMNKLVENNDPRVPFIKLADLCDLKEPPRIFQIWHYRGTLTYVREEIARLGFEYTPWYEFDTYAQLMDPEMVPIDEHR